MRLALQLRSPTAKALSFIIAGALAASSSSVLAQSGQKTPHSAHKHNQIDAHQLVSSLLHIDGVHALGGIGGLLGGKVAAVVKNGKVADMTSGGKPMTKVKSHQKMAEAGGGFIKAGYRPELQLAQYDSGYESYGYCEDDGYQETCYWYEPSDVDQSEDYEDYSTYESSY